MRLKLMALGVLLSPIAAALVSPTAATAQPRKMVMADDIPVAHTPRQPGGYGRTFPPPVLETCTEPLVAGAPDLRGIWKPIEHNGKPPEKTSRFYTYAERIGRPDRRHGRGHNRRRPRRRHREERRP